MAKRKKIVLAVLLGVMVIPGFSLDIQQVYHLALKRSNSVKSGAATQQALNDEASVATRAWLPSIDAEGYFNRGNFDGTHSLTRSDFDGVSIIARQTLFNYSDIARAMGAKYVRSLADYKFQITKQLEVVKSVKAYFDLLLAKRLADLAQLNKNMYKTGLYQIRVAKSLHLKTQDQVEFVQSDYEDAIADYLKARTAYSDVIALMETMIHQKIILINPLKANIVLTMQQPPPLRVWERRARQHNLAIRAMQASLDLADRDISIAVGDHLPQVSAVGSYNLLHNKGVLAYDGRVYGVSSNQANHIHGYSIGLEATIPIFSGGQASARVSSAEQKRDALAYQLQQVVSDVSLKTRSDYMLLRSDYEKIKAQTRGVRASELAVRAVSAEMHEHQKTELDLMKAKAKLGLAEEKYQESVYDYFKRYIDLHVDAGQLNDAVIFEINQYINHAKRIKIHQSDRFPL